MSPLLTSQGMALATAMAVSGTVILFLCRQRPISPPPQLLLDQAPAPPPRNLRSCISSHGKKGKEKKKKRVRFAEDVVHHHPIRGRYNGEGESEDSGSDSEPEPLWVPVDRQIPRMPANRVALYHGILQDRLQRMACSY